MSQPFELIPMPASREPVSLLAVDRAVSEIRRGRTVAIRGAGGRAMAVLAAEGVTRTRLAELAALGRSAPVLVITARRAAVLDLAQPTLNPIRLMMDGPLDAETVELLANPYTAPTLGDLRTKVAIRTAEVERFGCENAGIGLAKIARLLPAVVVAPIEDPEADDLAAWAARHDLLLADAGDIFQYEHTAARRLAIVSEAKVPLLDAHETRIVAFRPLDGGLEHLAIVFGAPQPEDTVLTRIHSECFTGDLLGSLRCDCGDQLRGAIREIAAAGSGVLLYLSQEGRGIGLVNKLRAYALQDRGFDTLDANEHLGFDADERVYLPAARMLRLLGFAKIRLMTNNPAKVNALARCGVEVTERVRHAFPSNEHNEAYLGTKAARFGHLF
jgi:GTP cyclohydrolase II